MQQKSLIVIPARYASTRFPGKPLTNIAGKSMVQRVCELANHAVKDLENCIIVVATDDERIKTHVESFGQQVLMTSEDCKTGSDRALAALKLLDDDINIVINLQGDAPLTPPSYIRAVLSELLENPTVAVATPAHQLTWSQLDGLRERKLKNPFSGTTVTIKSNNDAFWFSKRIIPGIRNEKQLRNSDDISPVFQHVGLYGFRKNTLERFVNLSEGVYEKLEGLEQLRLLENDINIRIVKVKSQHKPAASGVDTAADARHIEEIIAQYGEIIHD